MTLVQNPLVALGTSENELTLMSSTGTDHIRVDSVEGSVVCSGGFQK